MGAYRATVRWRREGDFLANGYSRVHELDFGAIKIRGTASPQIVAPPLTDPDAVDPEEMFVASISACHMLWFLDLARRDGITVEAYEDEAEGELERTGRGRMAMTRVVLRPKISCAADTGVLDALHHEAHERCFIANSVTTEIRVEPR